MPGTIQVSVLEFKGLNAASPPALLKVSLGKREYETSDMNDFSFPLTTLRDNLVLVLQDAEGNELAHLGIQTMIIVEKGSWDDIFPLDGGGYLHLKLNFELSQQEQIRIRAVREAALKKKEDTKSITHSESRGPVGDPGASSSQPEQIVSDSQRGKVLPVGSFDVSTQAGPLSQPSIPQIQQSDFPEEERSIRSKEIPEIDNREEAGSDPSDKGIGVYQAKKIDTQSSLPRGPVGPVSSQKASFKLGSPGSSVAGTSVSFNLREDQVESGQQDPPKKTISKVKKIASAFESALAQDVKYQFSIPAVKSIQKKVERGNHPKDFGPTYASNCPRDAPKDYHPTDASKEGESSLKLVTEMSNAESERGNGKVSAESYVDNVLSQGESRLKLSTSVDAEPRIDDLGTEDKGMSTGDLDRSHTRETATTSGRKVDFHMESISSCGVSAKQQDSGDRSFSEEEERNDPCSPKFSPSDESMSLEYRQEDLFLFDKSGMWTFLSDRKYLCVTTAGRSLMDLLGSWHTDSKSHQDLKCCNILEDLMEQYAQHETDKEEEEKDGENSKDEIKPTRSPSNDASGGLVAQAIKIAVIVGFGALVLFTRQKQPRKDSRNSENLDLFKTSEYKNHGVFDDSEIV